VRLRILLLALLAAVLLPSTPAAAAPKRHPVVPCSRGLVALTFDDGPLAAVTPRMVRLLTRLDVPATFFMVGDRVAAHPELVRMVDRAGFAIGNHTWAHADLTSQTPRQARHALVATRRALLDAAVQPTDLARPPYGAVNAEVRTVIASLGLVPALWTIDSRDWTGLTPRQISKRVIDAVEPHRINVVLQHDGVTNSPATLKALPDEVATLQKRGYCFAPLGVDGDPTPPVPIATVTPARHRIAEGDRVRLTVRLDRPTTRETTVHTPGGTARIPAGSTMAHLGFRAPQDQTDEVVEKVALGDHTAVRIVDDDPAPAVSIDDAAVMASPLLPTSAAVGVRLDRPSDRPTEVVVRSDLGPVRVTVPALAEHAAGALVVPVGSRGREVALHADGATAVLTIKPPTETWLQAARAAVADVRWPTAAAARLV
jgi:peptidoglycan/xylan/chitin deacetylase (PgdA/CDA1 family)